MLGIIFAKLDLRNDTIIRNDALILIHVVTSKEPVIKLSNPKY